MVLSKGYDMFSYFRKSMEQKELYFQIDKTLKLEEDEKVAGIYALYKDNICLYVGQSKNIASRIATHLSGKYKTIDRIEIYRDYDEKENLVISEKWLIQKLKPIENILADYTEKICEDDLICQFCDFLQEEIDLKKLIDYIIINDRGQLLITYDMHIDFSSNSNLADYVSNIILRAKESNAR